MANFFGKAYGGAALELLDPIAHACANSCLSRDVVILSVDQVMFREPFVVGKLVTVVAPLTAPGVRRWM